MADAAHTALLLADQRDFSGDVLHDLFESRGPAAVEAARLPARVTATLAGTSPTDRRALIERLYRLDPALLARFRAGRLGLIDRTRIQRALRGG